MRTILEEAKMSLPAYKKWKMKILKRDFLVDLTAEDIERINGMKSETEIDRYARACIEKRYH